jgi:homoserine dehydrogenase
MLANVEGAMNAVLVRGDAVGQTLYYGKGAGEEPTASAVVADLVDVTRLLTSDPEHRVPHLAFQPDAMADTPILSIDDVITSYYLRLTVVDQPGVLADLTRLLANSGISIGSMIQQPSETVGKSSDASGSSSEEMADLIFLTHEALERNVNKAIAAIEALPFVRSSVTRLRMESLT